MSQRAITAGLLLALAAACSGGSSNEPPAPGPLTGTAPRAGVVVAIAPAGTDGWVKSVTDGNGRFSVPWDGRPYDIAAAVDPGGLVVFVWMGQERNPIDLTWDHAIAPPVVKTATLTGAARDCTGGCLTAGSCLTGQLSAFTGQAALAAGNLLPSFSMPVAWLGSDSVADTLVDLWWSRPCATVTTVPPPGDFLLAQVPVTLVAGATAPVGTLTYAAPPTASLSLRLVHDPDVIPTSRVVQVQGYGAPAQLWPGSPDAGDAFGFPVPDVAGLRYGLQAGAQDGAGGVSTTFRWKLAPGPGEIAVALRRPPTLVSPADGASLPPNRLLRWTAVPDARYVATAWNGPPAPSRSARLFTVATEVRLPDLSALGFGFAPGGRFQWMVDAAYADAVLGSAVPVDPTVEVWDARSATWSSSIP